MKQGETVHDPKNYREMSKPFNSRVAANEALEAFGNEVQALREKYKVANILLIIKDSYEDEIDGPGEFMTMLSWGSQLEMEVMAAYGYMRVQAEHLAMINRPPMDASKKGR